MGQAPEATPGAAIRIGYARCSTLGQELQSQFDLLTRADCNRIFSEKISTRVKERPELEKGVGSGARRVPSCSRSWPWPPRWSGKASGRRRLRGWTLRPARATTVDVPPSWTTTSQP
ncbi:recombinase family protein [Streptomyces achromogenes]